MKPFALAVALCAAIATPAFGQHGAAHRMVMPDDLKWADVPSLPPGAKIAVIEGPLNEAVPFTFRLKLPKDYVVPAHWHPAIERVTVLSGTFHMGLGDKFDKAKTHPLPAGAIGIMQPRTNHFVWIGEETVIQLNGTGPWSVTYLDPNDDPHNKK